MDNSAIMEAITALNAWEIREFRRWLESPAFSTRAEYLQLYDYLVKCTTQNRPADATKIGQKLGISEEKKMRYLLSGLLDLIREYFIQKEMASDTGHREIYLLRAMRKRNLEKNFNLADREFDKVLEQTGQAHLDRFLLDFQRHRERYEWGTAQNRVQIFPFELLSTQLNTWYAGQLMQLACMEKTQQAVRRQENHIPPDWTLALLEQLPGQPQQQPSVALYYLGYQMLAQPNEPSHITEFRSLLAENAGKLPLPDAKGLLMLAINHGIRSINAGDRDAIRTTLDFYLFGLESKLLQDKRGILSKYTYNNVMMTFLALQRWEDALNFLEKYAPELEPSERENVYSYNLAIFHFRKGNYDETLNLLRNIHFSDPMYNLESRKMLLKIYFEQGDVDPLESLLENLLTWLRRHPEIGYHREMYRNLARFTGKMLRITPSDKDARERLRAKIRETPLVAERNWLLDKLGPG